MCTKPGDETCDQSTKDVTDAGKCKSVCYGNNACLAYRFTEVIIPTCFIGLSNKYRLIKITDRKFSLSLYNCKTKRASSMPTKCSSFGHLPQGYFKRNTY